MYLFYFTLKNFLSSFQDYAPFHQNKHIIKVANLGRSYEVTKRVTLHCGVALKCAVFRYLILHPPDSVMRANVERCLWETSSKLYGSTVAPVCWPSISVTLCHTFHKPAVISVLEYMAK